MQVRLDNKSCQSHFDVVLEGNSIFDEANPIVLNAKALILVICFGLCSINPFLFAQNTIQVKTLTTENGLHNRNVKVILQDTDGLMWLGTEQGIIKYDGNTFTIFNSNKSNPNFIPFEDIKQFQYNPSRQTLWYIANDRLFAFSLKSETIISHQLIDEEIKGKVIEILLDKNNNLWLIEGVEKPNSKPIQLLKKYDGDQIELIKSYERNTTGFTSLELTPQNTICWATINHGVTLFNQDGSILGNKILDTYDWFGKDLHFGESFFDSKGQHYYFPQSSGGIDLYENLAFKGTLFKHQEAFLIAVENTNGGIWFATKKELFYLNPSGEIKNHTSDINAKLDYENINHLFIDSTNLLWIATDNGLIKVKQHLQNFQSILKSKNEDWGRSFRSIFPLKNGNLAALCETESQLYEISKNDTAKPIPFKNLDQKLHNAKFFVSDTSKNKAYSVNDELIEINFEDTSIKTFAQFQPFLDGTEPNPIIQLKNGELLTGHRLSKLIRIHPDTKAYKPLFQKPPKEDHYILRCFEQSQLDPETIWVGTQNHGILKLNLNGSIEKIYTIHSIPALSKNIILSLKEVNTKLYIGTYGGGINILDLKNQQLQVINQEKGLTNDNVVSILTIDTNKMIAATYKGLNFIDLEKYSFQKFFEQDGITNNEFNYTSAYKSESGQFYFGGLNGITKFSVEHLSKKQDLPAINLTQIELFNQQKNSLIQMTRWNKKPVVLSPYDINLKVDWSIPDYFSKDYYTYYTKMEGLENQWFYQGNTNSIRYNQLPAGEYELKIKAIDINGNESKAGLIIPIVVNPIFYKTWWFILLMILCIAGIIYSVFQYRLHQVMEMERLRTKISSDLHDDVGSMLTGLAMQTEMLEMQATNPNQKTKLHKITHLSRSTISHMRDLVWSIDSRRDTLGNLVERLHELAEELLLPAGISYQIDIDVPNLQKKINFNCRRNLYLIYKEAINNIIKHSDAKQVKIKLNIKKGNCEFSIKDNGHIKVKKQVSGFGLVNMKMRAQSINADLKFDLEDGFGIYLSIPNVA